MTTDERLATLTANVENLTKSVDSLTSAVEKQSTEFLTKSEAKATDYLVSVASSRIGKLEAFNIRIMLALIGVGGTAIIALIKGL